MKKRILFGTVLFMMVLLPTFAAPAESSSWSAGISLGTSAQGIAQYRVNENLDITAGLGFGFFSQALYGDIEANYRVYKFDIQEETFDLSVGGGILFGLYDNQVEVSLYVPLGVYYSFAEDVMPLDLYFHAGPTIRLVKGYQTDLIGFYSYFGALYRF